MNSSTLRRLAADHSSLHTSELPPHYLFCPSASTSDPDDLTQLAILLTGPPCTPYSQGLWKLHLKIPEDYPKSPPKACFRTRIWHPNVEENSGSICVDTLKRDWQPRLTLRDVLITISCLLIQPNPDSALNATAGHLLQDDYASFERQARLMTSIHAGIPSDLKEAVLAAKHRGDEIGTTTVEDPIQRPSLKPKTTSSSSVVMKSLSKRTASTQSAPVSEHLPLNSEGSASEEEDEAKENDPIHSPSPVPAQSPRRPSLVKRPLSDLPTPTEPDCEFTEASCLSPCEQNIQNNTFLLATDPASDRSSKDHHLLEQSQAINLTSRGLQDGRANSLATFPFRGSANDDFSRPTKRVCSDESKENLSQERAPEHLPERALPVFNSTEGSKAAVSALRKLVAPGTLGTSNAKGKARMGLRRL